MKTFHKILGIRTINSYIINIVKIQYSSVINAAYECTKNVNDI